MNTQTDSAPTRLVRTSILIPEATDTALRAMAEKGNRPLSREIRTALEAHVARSGSEAA